MLHSIIQPSNNRAQEDIHTIIANRRWRQIGHNFQKDTNNVATIAMRWTPEGKRRRKRPKTTWRKMLEKELSKLKHYCSTIEKLAKNRQGWRDFVAAFDVPNLSWWVVSKLVT